MSYIDLLTTRALLGTARDAGDLPSPPGPLGDVPQPAASSRESALLRAAGAYLLYERAGRVPSKSQTTALHAPADPRPQCSPRAVTLFHKLLSIGETPLLLEWLSSCARADLRLPPAALPALLDAATRRFDNRAALKVPAAVVAGPPGIWLCRLNPEWSALVAEDASVDATEIWQTGTKGERLAALSRLRASHPAAARALLTSTFASEPAGDRAAFVDALSVGLGPDDEPFLEAALADRSKEVRSTTAALLARLPGSALVTRMIARLAPLIAYEPGEPAKLLRKAKPAKLAIELPAECDDAMKRDGIDPKPPAGAGYGERQYWLLQMLSMIPPSHWCNAFSATPAQLLEAIPKDHADLMKLAWSNATVNSSDPDWAEAYVRLGSGGNNPRINQHLVKLLRPSRRDDVVYEILLTGGLSSSAISDLVSSGPLDARSARVVMKWAAERASTIKTNHDYEMAQLLPALALAVPPSLLPEFEVAWPVEAFTSARNAHDKFFATLALRSQIQKEFAQ